MSNFSYYTTDKNVPTENLSKAVEAKVLILKYHLNSLKLI